MTAGGPELRGSQAQLPGSCRDQNDHFEGEALGFRVEG